MVVADGDEVPSPWSAAPEVRVDEEALERPEPVVTALHDAWLRRSPVVVRLGVDPGRFREPVSYEVVPWTLDAGFDAWLDRLHFLVWANTYDARGGRAPVWWWASRAGRAGARPTPDGPADVVLPDGTPAWVDGGPRQAFDSSILVVHRESVELGSLALVPPYRSPPDDALAPDQLAAVRHRVGPARVIAPAGSGKTRVLTERLRHLLGDRAFERDAVVAVAYNKKAQEELQTRSAAFRPRVETLNALGYGVVARARGRRPPVLDEWEVRRLVERLVPRQPRRANIDPIGPYLEAMGAIRLGLSDPDEVEESRDDVPGLAAAFGPYRAALADKGAIDFDEQVYGAIEALLADGAFRRAEQQRHRHMLVDEFQDLTPAHVLLIRLLATPQLDVFGVGDDDQVIYGHAGADPSFLIDFPRLFPGAHAHELEVNYRCPVAVVNAARTLLAYNDRRIRKSIRPGPGADPAPFALTVRTHKAADGAAALGQVVRTWLEDGAAPTDVAVMARVQSLLLAPHVALVEAGVPVSSIVEPALLQRTGVRAALAYLRIATRPGGFAAADVNEILRRPSRGLPVWIEKWIRGNKLQPESIAAIGARLDDARVAAKLDELAIDLGLVVDAAAEGTTRDVLRVVKDIVGLGRAMGLLDSSAAAGAASHLDDLEALEQVAELHPDPATFEPWLRDVLTTANRPDGVTLSTVHRVKGREWDRVAVFGVTGGVVPHRLADDVEEERRVLHVAITRGRRSVVVLADAGRPSPFLAELDGTAPRRPTAATVRAPADREPSVAGATRARPGRPAGPATPPIELGADGEAAFAVLRTWRAERSKRDTVPAYVVLHDSHLRAVAAGRPATIEQLARLPGIGPRKLELYGDEILAVLAGLG